MKTYYVVSWQYWETKEHCYIKVIHIFANEKERDEMYESLCPCVHEYPQTYKKEYTNEQIAEFLTKNGYCVHL